MSTLEDCRCIACNGPLRIDKESTVDEIVERGIACTQCDASYDHVWGVPILAHYEQADFAALVEVAANAQQISTFSAEGLDRWADILEGYHAATDRGAYTKTLGPGEAPFVSNRYTEWVALKNLLDGESLAQRDVLDVGAGLGFDAYSLVRVGARVTAMEFSPVLAREGRARLPMMRWIGGMSHILPFRDQSFDFVFANAALHHMRDVPAAIEEMLRVLRPGGILITTGDPYRADGLGEDAEVAIFNRHPDVLLGINEGVPRLRELVDVLERERGKIEPHIYTQMVYDAWRVGGGKTIEEFREWNFERDVPNLRGTSGSVAMKVRLLAPLGAPARVQKPDRLLRAASLARWMTSQSEAMAQLAAWAPQEVVNRTFPDSGVSKFELLNGWQAATTKPWRQAYRRARWYLRRTEPETHLGFELQASVATKFEILINGASVLQFTTEPQRWMPLSLDLRALAPGIPFAAEIRMSEAPASFDDGLFRVRRRSLSDASIPKPGLWEGAMQRMRAAFGA